MGVQRRHRAVTDALLDHLAPDGHELVLFDVNRSVKFGPLLRPSTDTVLARLLPPAPRNFRTAVITNAGEHAAATTLEWALFDPDGDEVLTRTSEKSVDAGREVEVESICIVPRALVARATATSPSR